MTALIAIYLPRYSIYIWGTLLNSTLSTLHKVVGGGGAMVRQLAAVRAVGVRFPLSGTKLKN